MSDSNQIEQLAVNTIRTLSMDAVQRANSGHPGTPMAVAAYMKANGYRAFALTDHDSLEGQAAAAGHEQGHRFPQTNRHHMRRPIPPVAEGGNHAGRTHHAAFHASAGAIFR